MTVVDFALDDCHSNNTERLDIAGVKAPATSLLEIRPELERRYGALA